MLKIAIDGPSGAGKSSLAKRIAKELNIIYVDTGALYRCIGLYMYRNNIDPKDAKSVARQLNNISVELKYENGEQKVLLSGEDVSEAIRITPNIGMYASDVSKIPEVRAYLLDTQRNMCETNSVIMDGRDIGTVIMPDAQVKIYLDASPEERAKRRYKELKSKGQDVVYETVLKDIIQRDINDSTREIAPALPADDAVKLDNSALTEDETLLKAIEIIKDKYNEVL